MIEPTYQQGSVTNQNVPIMLQFKIFTVNIYTGKTVLKKYNAVSL